MRLEILPTNGQYWVYPARWTHRMLSHGHEGWWEADTTKEPLALFETLEEAKAYIQAQTD